MSRRRGRIADVIVLSLEERDFLENQVRRRQIIRSLSDRCRIILLCADGLTSREVGDKLGFHEHTVGKWRRRFGAQRIEGLSDEFRSGRPRTLKDDQVAEVIERTLHTKPKDATHWSIRSMASEVSLSHTTIRRIWKAFGLQPHRSQTFKLSTDPLFVDKVQDIVGLYLSPPNRAIVLCVDEKSQIQALDREQPVLPMMPGMAERRTHTYIRHGTTSLFAALDIATGAVIGKCYKRHRAKEFLDFLKQIDGHVPKGPDVHLIMDNYATHKTPMIKAWLARRAHWHIHFTPTSASWINQVERWFAELTRKQLQRGVHVCVKDLEADIMKFVGCHNENPKPYKWVKSADEILASVKRFCLKTEQTLCGEL
jgi:transposase